MNAAKDEGDNLSITKSQKEIKVDMSSSDAISILGSPNMLATEGKRRESWA
ncbi:MULTISPECIES: hypothetical protein [unclassified Polynucleobacter]|uniref:hypothetical protein n=1 Tax=unclassified Polynucleobacter TaxID=2640945 RepID=UPI0025F8632A|nr:MULTISPECIES: hypothetical protein [unclassified Polynucleobacter]